jgi:DNA-binding IclR family transcriptional regulator
MKSLHKVIDIIDIIADEGSLGIRELAVKAGFPPATVYRIVSTLLERKYIQQDPLTRKYTLSLKFLELGTKIQKQYSLTQIARPYIEQLMLDTRENANLCALDGDEVIYLDHVHSDEHMLQSFTSLGTRVPLYATGVGKAILSQRGESEIKAYLKRIKLIAFTEKTFVNKSRLIKELKKIKNRGFALDNEERETGIRCIAAPIFDHTGQCNAGISVSGPALRITRDRVKELGKTVIRHAQSISSEIGFKETITKPY